MNIRIESIRARLQAPFASAWGSISDRPLVLVRVEDTEGNVGLGEAAPLPDYHGVDVDDVVEALETCREMLAGASPGAGPAEMPPEWGRLAAVPAVAAVDMALWDLEGRRTGQPVWRLLGAPAAAPVEVNYTIAAADRAGAAAEAAAARSVLRPGHTEPVRRARGPVAGAPRPTRDSRRRGPRRRLGRVVSDRLTTHRVTYVTDPGWA